MGAMIHDGAQVTALCPKCGGDCDFWVSAGRGYYFAVLAEQPCGCRLTLRQDQILRDRGEIAVDQYTGQAEQYIPEVA